MTGDCSSTASTIIEEIEDTRPVPTGILDEFGDHIYRLPWRDTVPIGFHHQYYQYPEDGEWEE